MKQPAMLRRALCAVLTTVVGTVAIVAMTTSSASALKYCGDAINYGGQKIAQICIQTQSGTQEDLVTLESTGSHYGKSKKMSFTVCTYAGGSPNTCKSDSGTFKYYAGPISKYACRRYTVKIWEPGDSSHLLVSKTITETCN